MQIIGLRLIVKWSSFTSPLSHSHQSWNTYNGVHASLIIRKLTKYHSVSDLAKYELFVRTKWKPDSSSFLTTLRCFAWMYCSALKRNLSTIGYALCKVFNTIWNDFPRWVIIYSSIILNHISVGIIGDSNNPCYFQSSNLFDSKSVMI